MDTISWYMSGFKSREEAEKKLQEMIDWSMLLPDKDKWTVNSSVSNGAFGFKAHMECEKNG